MALPRILLIGATGLTGQHILRQAESQGLRVRALVRRPSNLPAEHIAAHEVLRGDVLDLAALTDAMTGVDVVISVLGTPLTVKPVSLLSVGTTNLIQAMQTSGVQRLLCVTGMGAGDSRGHGGFVYDHLILPTLLRSIYADKDRQEQIVARSDLDWVLVRPARLVNRTAPQRYREITQFNDEQMHTISRIDVADFLVNESLFPRYHQQTVNLTT
ncbi:MAG: SDR family oxidoreductase [Gallionella sp.]|nr:SDR family oxidoreductase [Gallionella sp.]